MQVRLAVVVGWLSAYLLRRPAPVSETLGAETRLLREEIQAAREAVDQLGDSRRACEWEVWSQKWLLRIGGIVDLILILWIIWARFPLQRRDIPSIPALTADTSVSSASDTEPEPAKGDLRQRSFSQGKGFLSKGRPTRPSDLRSSRRN